MIGSERVSSTTAAGLVLVGCLLLGSVLATGVVVADSPPELVSGDRVDETGVELTFTDEVGVDTGSISESDFILSDGQLAGIGVSSDGPNATVELTLAEPIASDELTVALATDSKIADVEGRVLDAFPETDKVTIDGMDGVPPAVTSFETTDAHGEPGEIRLTVDERLDTLTVEVTGPENTTLERDDFERVNRTEYVTAFEPAADGHYEGRLVSMTDAAGNEATPSETALIDVRLTPPDAVASVDTGATNGTQVTLDASHSGGNVTTFSWTLGDGTTATGERVTHEYAPGIYTVELNVTDEYRNVGTDSLVVRVGDANKDTDQTTDPTPAVTIDRPSPDSTTQALVTARAVSPGTVIPIEGDEPLVESGSVALDAVSLTLRQPTGVGLVVSTADPTVIDTADATPISGLTLGHDISPAAFGEATLSVSIPESAIDEAGIDPAAVELRHERAEGWEPLGTTGQKDGERYRFQATTDSFSRFVVVTTQDDVAIEALRDDGHGGTDDTGEGRDTDETDDTDKAGDNGETGDNDGTDQANDTDGTDDTDETDGADGGDTVGSDGPVPVADGFLVRNVTVQPDSVTVDEGVTIEATVENVGEDEDAVIAALYVDGDRIETQFVGPMPPGGSHDIEFTRELGETGTQRLSVNDTEAGTVEVTEGDGLLDTIFDIPGTLIGIPGTLFGLLPLGFLPSGLVGTVLTYVVAPVAVIYLILKAIAIRGGY